MKSITKLRRDIKYELFTRNKKCYVILYSIYIGVAVSIAVYISTIIFTYTVVYTIAYYTSYLSLPISIMMVLFHPMLIGMSLLGGVFNFFLSYMILSD